MTMGKAANCRRRFGVCAVFVGLALMAVRASALQPRMENGIAFVSGGVGEEERDEMLQMRGGYSFLLKIAAKSGAYLGEAQVSIVAADKTVVLDTKMDGPWLLVKLPPGSYRLSVSSEGATQSRSFHVDAKGHREAVLYWDVEVQE